MTSSFREAMACDDGRQCLGSWVAVGHPVVAEVKAGLDIDFLVLDTEHAATSLETLENMVRAVDAAPGDTKTVVRVPWNDHVRLKRVLDMGIDGVLVPMIGTAEEVEALKRAVRYPPDGARGIAGTRATTYGEQIDEYVASANDRLFTIAQIETPAGVSNVDEIAGVDGIDGLFVGHSDLSARLGCFNNRESPELADAVEQVVEGGRRADIPVGTIVADPASLTETTVDTYDYLIVGKDITQLRKGTKRSIQDVRTNNERVDRRNH